jgi:DVNP family
LRFLVLFKKIIIFSLKFIMTEQTFGSKAQVWHGTAKKTSGGLTKKNLMMNKHGRIVSRRKHNMGKKSIKHLRKMGYIAKKGQFTLFHKTAKRGRSRKMRGGTGAPMGTGAQLSVPLQHALSAAKGGSRKMRGGMAYGGPLSPHSFDGQGVGTSGVALQFVAGNAA